MMGVKNKQEKYEKVYTFTTPKLKYLKEKRHNRRRITTWG